MHTIRVGIVGYGNLGKGVEMAIKQNEDMKLVGVFTRRDPSSITLKTEGVKAYTMEQAKQMKDQIDVMVLCGGSATDLPKQGPEFASLFNTIDSFDTHAKIPEYFANMDQSCRQGNTVSIICVGWDPGLFSLNRAMFDSILPDGKSYVFYGRGLSQGHSDAIRRVAGVKNAVQYTVPYEEAVDRVRLGEDPEFSSVRERMWRECFVVLEEGADPAYVEKQIKEMPNYFDEYNTVVHFISEEELHKNHATMPHGGFVLRSGKTGQRNETKQIAEFSLTLESNPEFTASVLIAYARAAYRMKQNGDTGAKTVFDIAPALLSSKTPEQMRKDLL